MRIILASGSPRRCEILKKAGVVFDVVKSDYKENLDRPLPPHELVKYLSKGKAHSVAHKYKNVLIIAADTIVVHEGKVLGKPKDIAHARDMLALLSGTSHQVVTGVTMLNTSTKKEVSFTDQSTIYFKHLTQKQIDHYIALHKPFDKAGAYGVQDGEGMLIHKVTGDYDTILGLPLKHTLHALAVMTKT